MLPWTFLFWRKKPRLSAAPTDGAAGTVPERTLLTNTPDTEPERLDSAVQDALTAIRALFPADAHVVAEALIPSVDGSQLITEEIEPITCSSLDVRIRRGPSLCWQAFETGKVITRAEIAPQTTTKRTLQAPVVETRRITSQSALCYPITEQGVRLGILNLESDTAGALDEQAVARLQQSGLLGTLARELRKVKLETLSDAEVADRLIDRMRARIPYIISPDDMTESNYQILSVAVSVVRPVAASAGLVLVYDKSQKLTTSKDSRDLYAVRASRYGRFNSDLEWELDQQSISRRIIQNRRGEFVPDAQADKDYRNSGASEGRTGELFALLMENPQDELAGDICLVTPVEDNFAGQADLDRVQEVAAIAVYAIRRSEEYKLGRRRAQQQDRARELQVMLSPLFPAEMSDLTSETIQAVRKRVAEQLLRWAADHTGSEHGAFVLIQTTPGPEGETTDLVMADTYDYGQTYPNRRKRWLPGDGVTGRAYLEKTTKNIPNVYTWAEDIRKEAIKTGKSEPEPYIAYFEKAISEIAVPLRIGDTVLGVLDVESDEDNHFTSDYVDWVEFLARQAAFALSTIERASKTYVELKMRDLARTVEADIATMRANTNKASDTRLRQRIKIIQDARGKTIKTIVDTIQGLTGAWVGRFLIELNAYKSDDTIDMDHGRLYYMYSSDEREMSVPETRFFRLGRGASSNALMRNKQYVFNDRTKLPEGYFDSDPTRYDGTKSGIFVPTLEGTHVSGVLNIECEDEGVFTPELAQACVRAGELISQLLTSSRLRVQAILRLMLRGFELKIAHEQSSNLNLFMDRVLSYAAQLSILDNGWGAIVQLQPILTGGQPQIERLFWKTYSSDHAQQAIEQSAQHPFIRYPLFRKVISLQEPRVILDRSEQDIEEREEDPWPPAARAVIAVPLVTLGTEGEEREVIGILALASPNSADFSEYDKDSLGMFAESIVSGLRTIALKQARTTTIEQLRQYIAKSLFLSNEYMESTLDSLQSAPLSPEALVEARNDLPRSQKLLQLAGNLTGWFLDLSNDELELDPQDDTLQDAVRILSDFKDPANEFKSLFGGATITWDIPAGLQAPLPSGAAVSDLIQAALFQYLDTAFTIKLDNTVAIGVQVDGSRALFSVRCGGQPFDERQQETLFALNPVSAGRMTARHSLSQAILGTFRVKQIARRLGGSYDDAYYAPGEGDLPNCFYLAVPLVNR